MLKANQTKAARQEETPDQKRARLDAEVNKHTSMLFNLIKIQLLWIITIILLLQADRSKTSRQAETPGQRQARLDDKVSISMVFN